MEENLVKELEEIGLSEKEARVYLAALELGPATAQQIATKALINRPTTYIMIESLTKRGLMSSFIEGKKKKFSAAMPYKLAYIIQNQKKDIEKREIGINNLIKKMQEHTANNDNLARVEVFSGVDSFTTCQGFVLQSEAGNVYELTDLEKTKELMPNDEFKEDVRNQICEKHRVSSIYSANSSKSSCPRRLFQQAMINNLEDPIGAEVVICKDTIFFNTYNKQLQTVMITDSGIALTLKTLYKALWEKAKKYD
ncbi:hypothetical protein KKC47_04855 [Patescibacteria group bacterium]|nr:hypothetical protein [Patescibacteria group bacterium]